MKTRIDGRWVVAFVDGDHHVISDGVVVYADDEVVHVGSDYTGSVDRRIDATDHLVTPGFVNLHCVANTDIQLLGLDVSAPVYPESTEFWTDSGAVLNQRLTRTGVRHAIAQALRMGSTTVGAITTMATKRWSDPPYEPRLITAAMQEFGVRGYVAHQFHSGSHRATGSDRDATWDEARGETGLQRAIELVERLQATGSDRVQGYLFPYTLDSCSPSLLRAAKDAADRLGTHLRTHFAQSEREVKIVRQERGTTPVYYLEDLGVLDTNVVLTHCLYTAGFDGTPYPDGRELALLADRGVTVCHEPVVFARRGKFLESVARYRDHGVTVALGTDTAPQDQIGVMRCARGGNRAVDGPSEAVDARALFDAATLGGARALSRGDIGRLQSGAKADIVCVDLTGLHVGPVDDPIETLVSRCYGPDIDRVVVDGRDVVTDGSCVAAEGSTLRRDARETLAALERSFVKWDPEVESSEELFPPSFEMKEPPEHSSAR